MYWEDNTFKQIYIYELYISAWNQQKNSIVLLYISETLRQNTDWYNELRNVQGKWKVKMDLLLENSPYQCLQCNIM